MRGYTRRMRKMVDEMRREIREKMDAEKEEWRRWEEERRRRR